jgi:alpha-galactosidase
MKRFAVLAFIFLFVHSHVDAAGLDVRRDDKQVRVANAHVSLVLERAGGGTSIAWASPRNGALANLTSVVEVNGQPRELKDLAIESEPFANKLGTGTRLVQRSSDDLVGVERAWVCYDDSPIVTQSLKITNRSKGPITLGTMKPAQSSGAAAWRIANGGRAPAAVWVQNTSQLMCGAPAPAGKDAAYQGTQFLALADAERRGAMMIGFLTAREAMTEISAQFTAKDAAGTALVMQQRCGGRQLPPGQSVELDPIYFNAEADPYAALEHYGDDVARFSPVAPRKGANALWCSWYAHRMSVNEDLVLANAAVAARHFQPLGMSVMQIDHGWQRGEVTGDWVAKDAFPHGLKWLSDELAKRYDMKLGLWIAPTDVADTSNTYKQHADWMLRGNDGKPLVNWKWYWKPNPNCYELDATNPAAAKWMEQSFAQLTSQGASYYKIDFIASSGGEQFRQSDPTVTRGWGNLVRAMQSVRNGAGERAWIRYCQVPPLLGVGLADSVIGGGDTLDGGRPETIGTLRENARSLAAGYWINDRLYHREVCDMSVRMQADVEEVRLRLGIMALAGCSISFSDELQYLPPSRIRMMQQCLPAGGPAMKPIDLFERDLPSVWNVHCGRGNDQWDIVGLFNFDDQPQEREVQFASLGLPADADVAVFEFWREHFEGVCRGGFKMTLPPHTSRILSLRRLRDVPQVVGTDMHVLQGVHDLTRDEWDDHGQQLRFEATRLPGASGKIFIHVPEKYEPRFNFPLDPQSASLTHVEGPIWACELQFKDKVQAQVIPFGPKDTK